MSSDTVKARIRLKNDTEKNWNKTRHFVPLKGELIVYSADEAHPFSRLKVGDGITLVGDLPFCGAVHPGDSGAGDDKNIYIDTAAHWLSHSTYIPNRNDILIWTERTNGIPGIKIGDGLAYNVDLPFVGDDYIEMLNLHSSNTTVHITAAERTRWDNKLNCEDTVIGETLILNRS